MRFKDKLPKLLHAFMGFTLTRFYSTTHIYIDESICIEASLATLTGIFIPARKLKRVTKEYYRVIAKILDKFPKTKDDTTLVYNSIVLHGKSFLQNSKENKGMDFSAIDDAFRIELLKGIVKIAVTNKLRIVRVGFNNYNEFIKSGIKDDKMYSVNWSNLLRFIDIYAKNSKVICIMDGNNIEMINKISSQVSSAKSLFFLYPKIANSLTNRDIDRFIGNVYYVPSKYCEFLQIVDIIAYILHKHDYIGTIGQFSEFSASIYDLYDSLNNKNLINQVGRLNIN